MKQNKKLWLRIAILSICVLLEVYGIVTIIIPGHMHHDPFALDLYFRHNEVSCAHQGIDPFDIFERKVVSEEFCGLNRPDFPIEKENGRKTVHAYPAWHMAVFWWYGYVSRKVCIIIMIGVNLCFLAWACYWTSKQLQQSDCLCCVSDILILMCMMLFPFGNICLVLNYGLMLLGCMLLLYTILESKQAILAGAILSLIMIKPQIGVLLLIPLFINKEYKIIVIAGIICIVETLFTAWQLNKSPIELILQLPQIGAPFHKGFFADIAVKVFGPMGQFLSMGFFVAIVFVGCFLLRNAEAIWVRFLPAVACIPFWTYSQNHDWFVTLPCYIYILNNKDKYPRIYKLCFLLVVLWVAATFIYYKKIYLLGDHKLATPPMLALLSISCFMAILDEKERWKKQFSPKDLFSQMCFWKTKQ